MVDSLSECLLTMLFEKEREVLERERENWDEREGLGNRGVLYLGESGWAVRKLSEKRCVPIGIVASSLFGFFRKQTWQISTLYFSALFFFYFTLLPLGRIPSGIFSSTAHVGSVTFALFFFFFFPFSFSIYEKHTIYESKLS